MGRAFKVMSIFKRQKSKVKASGFTLVELLVVIAVIAILFAVILLALNPAQRFKDSRNARRLTDVRSISDSISTYTADKKGSYPANIPDGQCIGSKSATVVTDPGSRAHWKFDEASGNAADSSGGGFTGTIGGATSYIPAKFNNGLNIQGSIAGVSAAGTIDDTMTNALTLEGWIKLNQKIEAGSFDHHQVLFDKGAYQLQLNADSGKLELHLQGGTVTSSEYNAGTDSFRGINALMQFRGTLFAGSLKENGANDYGAILKKSSTGWSVDLSYPAAGATGPAEVNALTVYNGKLYSGQTSTDGKPRVYAFDGTSWQNTNLENLISTADVLALTRFRGKLYAGLGSLGGAYVAEYDGSNWRISRQFDSTSEALSVNTLTMFNGKLYAGTGRGSGNAAARLFEFDGTSWVQRFSPAQMGSKDGVYGLAEFQGNLVIGMGGLGVNDGVIYIWDGAAAAPTVTIVQGPAAFGSKVLAFGVIDGSLYAGWSGLANGQARLFAWDPSISRWVAGNTYNGAEIKNFYQYRSALYFGIKSSDPTLLGEIIKIEDTRFAESSKSSWQPNIWYHIAGVYDGTSGTITLYVNGSVDSQTTVPTGNLTNVALTLYMGFGYASDALSGVIDDFALYHSVLSDATIASHAGCYNLAQYIVPEYMGKMPDDPSSTVTDGTDTGYGISQTGGVVTITAPLSEITSSVPTMIKSSR